MSASVEELKAKLRKDDKVNYKMTTSDDVVDLFELTYQEYSWSFWDVLSMPIPSFFMTVEALVRRKKKEVKSLKKKK